MNKKILIGSIIAITVLIGISFSGVVGYQNVKSSSAINSPLFGIRTQRAIDKESKDLTCDYVGKEEETPIIIPKRDNRTEFILKFVKIINKMDDNTLNMVIVEIQNKIYNDNSIKVDGEYITKLIHLFGNNQNDLKDYLETNLSPSFSLGFTSNVQLCILLAILFFPITMIFTLGLGFIFMVNVILTMDIFTTCPISTYCCYL